MSIKPVNRPARPRAGFNIPNPQGARLTRALTVDPVAGQQPTPTRGHGAKPGPTTDRPNPTRRPDPANAPQGPWRGADRQGRPTPGRASGVQWRGRGVRLAGAPTDRPNPTGGEIFPGKPTRPQKFERSDHERRVMGYGRYPHMPGCSYANTNAQNPLPFFQRKKLKTPTKEKFHENF
jgi:hypothetical protein